VRAPLAADAREIYTEHPCFDERAHDHVGRVIAAAQPNGLEEFLFLHRPPTGRSLGRIPGARCSLAGQHRGRYAPVVFDLDLQACTTLPRVRR